MKLQVLLNLYKLYGLAFLMSLYLLLIMIQTLSTLNGLESGVYSILVRTNEVGENNLEMILEYLSLPAAFLVAKDFLWTYRRLGRRRTRTRG